MSIMAEVSAEDIVLDSCWTGGIPSGTKTKEVQNGVAGCSSDSGVGAYLPLPSGAGMVCQRHWFVRGLEGQTGAKEESCWWEKGYSDS